eukprot:13951297-Alexandrium_andersonii.AAC.1
MFVTRRILGRLRDEALTSEALPEVSTAAVASAMGSFAVATGVGLDAWEPGAWKVAPPAAVKAMKAILAGISDRLAWPSQALCQQIWLTVKPNLVDDRPLTLQPMVVRLWHRLHKWVFREWSIGYAGHWDKAIVGSSALRSMVQSIIVQEVWAADNLGTAQVCWDVEKFYDDISLVSLACAAVSRNYPQRPLVLA